MDEEPRNSKLSCDASAVAESDSILDFRSPESKITKTNFSAFTKSNVAKQKKKTTTKFKNSVKSRKETQLKLDSGKRKSSQRPQASVESTFFKAKDESDNAEGTSDVKMALLCPLCFKTCKDLDSQVLHMKICACKNNISTRKLLEAIELQKRQANERKLLGLLSAPILQDKKKQAPHRTNSHVDSDLQLALALSKSLQEAEELDEINGIERLSEIPNQSTSEVVELSTYKRQLEKIGFGSKEPAPFIKSRRRKYSTITPLKTRTQEERNRILTERIAEILMGNEPITQKQTDESDRDQAIKAEIVLKSYLLRRLCRKEDKLWDKARLTPSRKGFHVTNLSEYIFPQEKEMEIEEENTQLANACEMDDKKSNEKEPDVSSTCSTEKQFFEISQTDLCFESEKCKNCGDSQFTDSLITIWGNALNESSASDIIIFVNNGKHIWAHKLVFYVRCSNILLDVVPNDTLLFNAIKEKICWLEVPYDIALAFLEFIYCGVIRKYSSIFEDSRNFCSLRNLARKYKVQELFAYLQRKEVEAKRTKAQILDVENTGREKTLVVGNEDTFGLIRSNSKKLIREDFEVDESEELNEEHLEKQSKSGASGSGLKRASISNLQSSVIIDLNTLDLDEDTRVDQSTEEEIDHLTQISTIRYSNVSPDMFDDVNDITLRFDEKCTDQMTENEERKRDATPESVILDFVNDITVDTDSSKTINTISSKNVEQFINSLPNTPDPSTSKITKLKSNLSIFIEQFQKENAKSDSDIDSEVSILSERPKLNRNPFAIIQHDTSNDSDVSNENSLKKLVLRKQQGVSNMLDDDTMNSKSDAQATSDESDSDMCLTLGAMGNLTQSIKHKETSAESPAKNNSINNGVNNAEEEIQNNVTPSATKSLLQKSVHLKHLQYDRDQDSITSDTDVDENEMSMYTRYKRSHRKNSIVKYRDFVKEHILNNSSESSQETEEYEKSNNNVDNEDVTVLSEIDMNSDCAVTSEERHDEEKNLLSVDNTTPVSSQRNSLNIQRRNNSSNLRYSKSESNINVGAIRNNSLVSTTKSKTNESGSVDSPVLICSSPEFDCEALNANTSNESNAPNNILNLIDSRDNTHIFERDIYLANVRISDDDGSSASPVDKTANRLYKSNSTLSYNKGEAVTNNENNELIRSKSLMPSDSRRETSLNDRNFRRKSKSEASLNVNKKDANNSVSDLNKTSNRDLCKCGRKRTLAAASPVIVRDNVTPPPDYDGMKSPELHAALNKYGLKLQKRNKAVKLLTYIYNELHPTLCTTPKSKESEFAIISSEDEEPPMKRMSYRENINCVEDYEDELPLSQASTVIMQSPVNVIDEERPNNVVNIEDVFLKLIKVKKELYNNILAYEPICIESVHSMLKEEGLKCKMNEVMDFLDEQCITFYFNKSKRSRVRKA